jgi:hypothetical protein
MIGHVTHGAPRLSKPILFFPCETESVESSIHFVFHHFSAKMSATKPELTAEQQAKLDLIYENLAEVRCNNTNHFHSHLVLEKYQAPSF